MFNYIELNIVEVNGVSMKRRSGRYRKSRNFWREWDHEQEERMAEDGADGDSPHHGRPHHRPTRAEMRGAWRNFFEEFTGETPEDHWVFGKRRFSPWHKGDVSFNPFVAMLFSQGGGLLPVIVLHLLAEKPRYGNEIMTLLNESTSGGWIANPGAVYPLMATLEEKGFIEGEWEDPQKRTIRIYKLTEFGKYELQRVKAVIQPKLEEAVDVLQVVITNLSQQENESNDTIGDIENE